MTSLRRAFVQSHARDAASRATTAAGQAPMPRSWNLQLTILSPPDASWEAD